MAEKDKTAGADEKNKRRAELEKNSLNPALVNPNTDSAAALLLKAQKQFADKAREKNEHQDVDGDRDVGDRSPEARTRWRKHHKHHRSAWQETWESLMGDDGDDMDFGGGTRRGKGGRKKSSFAEPEKEEAAPTARKKFSEAARKPKKSSKFSGQHPDKSHPSAHPLTRPSGNARTVRPDTLKA